MSRTHLLTAESDRTFVEVETGDTIRVTLEESPSTGYVWEHATPEGEETWKSSYAPQEREGGEVHVGGSTQRTFETVAQTPGELRLSLHRIRPWLGAGSAISRHDVVIRVR